MEAQTLKRSIWIDAPRERVWQAVSDPVQIAQWFAPGTDFFFKDNIITIRMNETDLDVALIEVMEAPRQLTTRSLPDKLMTTTYLLEEENGGTRFTVIEAGFEGLSAEDRQKRLEQDSAGWDMALENLKAYIDGKPLPRPEGF
jgi:uncharacterized protein YndB with AHSA1/START domain